MNKKSETWKEGYNLGYSEGKREEKEIAEAEISRLKAVIEDVKEKIEALKDAETAENQYMVSDLQIDEILLALNKQRKGV